MLSEQQKNIIIQSIMPYRPKYIGIFGSVARNEDNNESDIDLLLDLNYPNLSLLDIGAIYSDLENKLKRKIDIAFKHSLKKQLEKEILSHTITIFEA